MPEATQRIIVPMPPVIGGKPIVPAPPDYGLGYVPEIDFAVKDPLVIQQEVILAYEAAFKALTGVAKSLAPGDPVRLFLLVVCEWLSHQRTIIDFTGKQNLLKYAREDYLDNLAALHGIRTLRMPASPALTTLEFTLTTPLAYSVIVPSGTQASAPSGSAFETLADGTIAAGELTCDVPAKSLETGAGGNGFLPGQVNGIINWNQPYALNVTNITETAGGSDEENDEQYRYRIWLAIESYSTCGPRDAYEFWALSAHPDIIQCVVHSEPAIAGEVHLYPLLKDGQLPTQDILDAVLAKCSADRVRPLTDYVFAHAPTVFNYSLNISYYIREDDETLLTNIDRGIKQSVTDWILWQRSHVGRDLNCQNLVERCLNVGAKRIVITTPTPQFQVMLYNQLACHTDTPEPIISYGGSEEE